MRAKAALPRVRPVRSVALLGLGKAGTALHRSLRAAGIAVTTRARRVAGLTAAGLAHADVLVLAVPDSALHTVAIQLAARGALPPLVVHLAGSLGFDVLQPLASGAHIGCMHPLAALHPSQPVPRGTLAALDASSPGGLRALVRLARTLGLEPYRVGGATRVSYHAGAVVAANLAVALLADGVVLLGACGIPEQRARKSLAALLRSTADLCAALPLDRALTGPVARGDATTVSRHLALLDARNPELAAIYRALSLVLLNDVAKLAPAARKRIAASLRP